MGKMHSSSEAERVPAHGAALARGGLLLVVLAAAFLLLWRLGTPLLWQDEAETANVAENLLHRGVPTPWDGEHLVTQQEGHDAVRVGGTIVWAWHPWPQHYLAAAGLALAGDRLGRTAAARLPFALLGLLTVPLVYAWRRGPTVAAERSEALVTTAIYALSIGFVLYSRQCRYYPLLYLGGLLAFWAYQSIGAIDRPPGPSGPDRPGRPDRPDDSGWRGAAAPALALGSALAVVFYANPLTGGALGIGFGADALLHARTGPGSRRRLRRTLAAGALFGLLAAPWLALVLRSSVRPPDLGTADRAFLFVSEVWRFQYALLPLVFWPALAWLWLRGRRADSKRRADSGRRGLAREIELLAVTAGTLLVLVSLEAPLGTVRYLLPLWPLCAAVTAGLWRTIHARSAALGALFLVVVLGTDLAASLPALPVALARPAAARAVYDRQAPALDKLARQGRPGVPLAELLAQQAHATARSAGPAGPTGPIGALVAFARGLERPPRAVVAGYGWESLHFYLGVPAVGPGRQRAARRRLGLPPFDPRRIDLVVPRRGWPPPEPPPDVDRFVRVGLGVPDDAYENLPDPDAARFGPSSLPELTVLVRRSLLPPGDRPPAAGHPGGAGEDDAVTTYRNRGDRGGDSPPGPLDGRRPGGGR